MTQQEILTREPNMERASGYNSYFLTCLYHGQKIKIHTHDSQLWDKWTSCEYMSREYMSMCRSILKRFINYKKV